MNVPQTLRVAKEFLQSKEPSVLAEFGGNIKLSYSWGSSLLKRMTEKEAEVESENKSDNSSSQEPGPCDDTGEISLPFFRVFRSLLLFFFFAYDYGFK